MKHRRLTPEEIARVQRWECDMQMMAQYGGQDRKNVLPRDLGALEFEERQDAFVNQERHLIFTREVVLGLGSPGALSLPA